MEYKEAEKLILEGLKKEFPGHDILFSPVMKEEHMGEPERELVKIIVDNQMTNINLYKELVQDIIILKSIDPIPELVALLSDQIRNKVKFN